MLSSVNLPNNLTSQLSFQFADFIQNSDAEHIRGTECDQKILSKKESSGQVFSPNYPFPYQVKQIFIKSNFNFFLEFQSFIVCRYFIYGMQDSQNLERVVLTFDKFDIPMLGKQKNKYKIFSSFFQRFLIFCFLDARMGM